MALVRPGNLLAIQTSNTAGGLGRPQVTAVAEYGGQVARQRVVQFPGVTGDRAKRRGPIQPVRGRADDIQNVDWRDPLGKRRFERGQAGRVRPAWQPVEHGSPSSIRSAWLDGNALSVAWA